MQIKKSNANCKLQIRKCKLQIANCKLKIQTLGSLESLEFYWELRYPGIPGGLLGKGIRPWNFYRFTMNNLKSTSSLGNTKKDWFNGDQIGHFSQTSIFDLKHLKLSEYSDNI